MIIQLKRHLGSWFAMNLTALTTHKFPAQRVSYAARDTILYALSVGAGVDPLNAGDLKLVYEKDLCALPSMATVLAYPGVWINEPQFGVDYLKLLHGEQDLTVHKTLPPQAEVLGECHVTAVVDKGPGRGVLVYFSREIRAAHSRELYCTVSSTLFLRADGGCGNYGVPPAPQPAVPVVAGEKFHDQLRTTANMALLYRLNGDLNPIHADPVIAGQAGFDRPILHGLCSYGVAGYMLVRSLCGYDPSRLRSLGVRFSAPVYPGETLSIDGTLAAGGVHFRVTALERNQVVMTNGYARVN